MACFICGDYMIDGCEDITLVESGNVKLVYTCLYCESKFKSEHIPDINIDFHIYIEYKRPSVKNFNPYLHKDISSIIIDYCAPFFEWQTFDAINEDNYTKLFNVIKNATKCACLMTNIPFDISIVDNLKYYDVYDELKLENVDVIIKIDPIDSTVFFDEFSTAVRNKFYHYGLWFKPLVTNV